MSREPDGDEPFAIYEMGRWEPVAYIVSEPGGRPEWVESEPEVAVGPAWSPVHLADETQRIDEEAKAREGLPAPKHRVSRWNAWTRPRFSYLELIGIYVVVTTLVDLVWHRG